MKLSYADDIDYAAKRLNGTVVRKLDGSPLYIGRTAPGGNSLLHTSTNFVTGEDEVVAHEDLDLEPIPLGYINLGKDMTFVMRKPMRRDYHQGFCHNNIATCGRISPLSVELRTLVQPVLKRYPTFSQCLAAISSKSAIAFSRDFGFTRHNVLHFRGHPVGKVEAGVAVLNNDKFFLQQHLDEALTGV